eukprot:tig00021035_g17243.t1
MGTTPSKISSWSDESACAANVKETALDSFKVGSSVEENEIVRVCAKEGATYYSGTNVKCTQCPPLTNVETFSDASCAGTSLYTAAYKGELSDQSIATSCGRGAHLGNVKTPVYYKASAGEMGGTDAACTMCPPVTGVFTYSDDSCSASAVNSDVYYSSAGLSKDAPELSEDVACDAKGSKAFTATATSVLDIGGAHEVVGCTPCTPRSILRVYPYDNCKAEPRDPAKAQTLGRLEELFDKSDALFEVDEVGTMQNARLVMEGIEQKYGSIQALYNARGAAASKAPEQQTDADKAALNDFNEWLLYDKLYLRFSSGLTPEEVDEAIRLALDVADDPMDLSAQERVVDGGSAEVDAAIYQLCGGAFREFQYWKDGDSSSILKAHHKFTPAKSYAVTKGTALGQERSCQACPTVYRSDVRVDEGMQEAEEEAGSDCEADFEEASLAADLCLAACAPEAELAEALLPQ